MVVELSVVNGNKKVDEHEFYKEYSFIFNNILELSDDIIITLNHKKQITNFSDKFKELIKSDAIDIIGENFINILSDIIQLPNDFFNEKSYFLSAKSHDIQQVFYANIIKNEKSINNRYIIILKDIDKKQEIQAQKDNFIATLTHDLKTPVRADILTLELLLKGNFGELQPKQKEIVSELLNSGKFMMSMLDTLLAKYKYENDCVELHKTSFDLNDFVENCVKDLNCIFKERHVKYVLNFTDTNAKINADKIELKRALTNLISNSIKFNKFNGKVILSVKKENNMYKIIIEDNGIGMSQDKLEHIFDKYVSYTKRFRRLGTGLGLYVAKKITEAHNGKIEVSSIPKKGSVFTITIPSTVQDNL